MSDMIFVNLPVADLDASKAFYTALGFENNPVFTDESAACMVLNAHFAVMLITHPRWREFTDRPIPPKGSSEVMIAVPRENKEAVDATLDIAQKYGGTADVNAKQDLGFMYNRSLTDLDGHIWEVFWMDMAAFPGNAEQG
jgi:predicted lactoylglutathione lyase